MVKPGSGILEPEVGPIEEAGPLEIPTGGCMPLGIDLKRNDQAVGGQGPREVQRRDADRRADLDDPPSATGEREDLQQAPGLWDDDRDPVTLAVRFHLREQWIGLRTRRREICLDRVGDDHWNARYPSVRRG